MKRRPNERRVNAVNAVNADNADNADDTNVKDPRGAKLTAEDVALARLIARDGNQPRGWLIEFARSRRVSNPTLVMAIGGRTWKWMQSPPPVPSFERTRPSTRPPGKRPRCPTCGFPKWHRENCRNRFHTIDHRTTGWSRRYEP